MRTSDNIPGRRAKLASSLSSLNASRRSAIARTALALFVLLGVSGIGNAARAEELGTAGNLVISAERLFGIYLDNESTDRGNAPDDEANHTVFALGWGSAGTSLTVPRLGVDYFINSALTVGGNFGFYSHNVDGGGNQSVTFTGLILAGRAGYALRLGHAISFWPRGGLTYTTATGGNHVLSFTIDAPFTLSPSEGFAFLAGPCLELGLIGARNRADHSEILFGLMVGLAGWFGL